MNDIKLSSLVAPVYRDTMSLILNSNRDILLYGGRSSAKGTTVYIACIIYLVTNQGRTILVNAPKKESIGETVFAQIKETIEILNSMLPFKIVPKRITTNPFKITFDNGSRFIFNGLLDGQKGSTGIDKVVIDEMGEIRGSYVAISNMLSDMANTYNRNGTQVIKIGNPPQSIASFFNQHIEAIKKEKKYFQDINQKLYNDYAIGEITKAEYDREKKQIPYILHTTCYDIPEHWNAPKHWQNVALMKDQEERGVNKSYSHQILGLATGTGFEVFNQVEEITITPEFLANLDRNKVCAGLDEGHSVDPLALIVCYYEQKTQELWILHEFYGTHKTFSDIEKAIVQKVHPYHMLPKDRKEYLPTKEIKDNDVPIIIWADSQASRFIEELRNRGLNIAPYKKKRSGLSQEIAYMENNLSRIYIDRKRTPNAYREFTEFTHKTDIKGTPSGEYSEKNNHTIDATRYAIGEKLRSSRSKSIVFVG